jgi:hypothetical protein
MSQTGWVEDHNLITTLHDTATIAIDAATARYIAKPRFHQPLAWVGDHPVIERWREQVRGGPTPGRDRSPPAAGPSMHAG